MDLDQCQDEVTIRGDDIHDAIAQQLQQLQQERYQQQQVQEHEEQEHPHPHSHRHLHMHNQHDYSDNVEELESELEDTAIQQLTSVGLFGAKHANRCVCGALVTISLFFFWLLVANDQVHLKDNLFGEMGQSELPSALPRFAAYDTTPTSPCLSLRSASRLFTHALVPPSEHDHVSRVWRSFLDY